MDEHICRLQPKSIRETHTISDDRRRRADGKGYYQADDKADSYAPTYLTRRHAIHNIITLLPGTDGMPYGIECHTECH